MNKPKVLLFALALSFSCGMLATLPCNAIDEVVNDEITVTDDEDPSTGGDDVFIEEDTGEAVTTNDDESTPVEEDCDNSTDENCQSDTPERYDTDFENAVDEGLANEPEVICATGNEEGCNEESNPEMWTLYISLGVLAATILLVIIINLLGRKKK